MEEGSRIVTLFAEDPKKVPSSQIYSILANSITLIDRADAANKRDVEKSKKAKKNKRKKLKKSSNQPGGSLDEAIKRPIAPPKPPPSLANRGSRGASKEFVQKNFDSDSI